MNDPWYYEYEVIVNDDGNDEVRRGVICADSYAEAAATIDEYYDSELVKISKLFCSRDCLYEFNGFDTEYKIHVEA